MGESKLILCFFPALIAGLLISVFLIVDQESGMNLIGSTDSGESGDFLSTLSKNLKLSSILWYVQGTWFLLSVFIIMISITILTMGGDLSGVLSAVVTYVGVLILVIEFNVLGLFFIFVGFLLCIILPD